MRKKLIIGWTMGKERYATEAIRAFAKRGYDTVYCIANDDGEEKPDGVVFHDKQQAGKGIPARGINPLDFPPPSVELLNALVEPELLSFSMMNRFSHSTYFPEKFRLYHELVRYWDGILDRYRPDAIVLSSFPHHLAMFVLYTLARLRGIETLFVRETFVGGRVVLHRHYTESPLRLPDRLAEHQARGAVELPDDLERYYTLHREHKDTSPAYMKDMRRMFSFRSRLMRFLRIVRSSLADGSIFMRAYNAIGRIGTTTVADEYHRLVTTPDLSVPYVYVPLHLQPESSTAPIGGPFVDQLLMIEMLSHALPEGWLLYVKENPYQFEWDNGSRWNLMRYQGYYEKIVALPNARLVPHTFDTFALTVNAKAVATVTGTASLEAIFRDIPALTFGSPWYMDLPGLLRVDSVESARAALTRVRDGYRPEQGPIRAYLKSLHEVSVIGSLDPLTIDPALGVSREETVPRIAAFLADELEKMLPRA